ncbi:MAG TPA: hypothetical protein VHZ26_08425 [Caulobacteraceae bacterium]|jgi:hypothetical protein|nr:hypothetical protein [Caulobacteraceae bacterium]
MTKLYWAVHDDRAPDIFALLDAMGLHPLWVPTKNFMAVIELNKPEGELLRETFSLIRSGALRSAALVTEALSNDDLWIACEWWGKLVADVAQADQLNELGAQLEYEHAAAGRTVLIFLPPDPKGAGISNQDLSPIRTRRVSTQSVLKDPSAFYGDLADPIVGGANALFAAGEEAASIRGIGSNHVLVGAPEAFGFEVDPGATSVTAWRQKGVIAVEAVGFSLGDWDKPVELATVHGVAEGVAEQWKFLPDWTAAGFQFGLAIVLKGLADPPVVIPMGSVYQQPVMGAQAQNLAAAQSVNAMVAAGATVPVVLPAYCLNPFFAPPSGPMTPTALVYTAATGTQSAIWDQIARGYRGQL